MPKTNRVATTWDNQQPEAIRISQLYLHPWNPAVTKDNQFYLLSQKSADIRDTQACQH